MSYSAARCSSIHWLSLIHRLQFAFITTANVTSEIQLEKAPPPRTLHLRHNYIKLTINNRHFCPSATGFWTAQGLPPSRSEGIITTLSWALCRAFYLKAKQQQQWQKQNNWHNWPADRSYNPRTRRRRGHCVWGCSRLSSSGVLILVVVAVDTLLIFCLSEMRLCNCLDKYTQFGPHNYQLKCSSMEYIRDIYIFSL